MTRIKNESVVARAANELRSLAYKRAEGDLLGSDRDLALAFGISRPTLRQAAALVMQEELLTARRGVKGGYYVRKPTTSVVAHMMALYLKAHGAALHEIADAVEPIRVEIAVLSARHRTATDVAELKAMLEDSQKHGGKKLTSAEHTSLEVKLNQTLCRTCGNKVLAMIFEMLFDFGSLANQGGKVNLGDGGSKQFNRLRDQLIAAIIKGDEGEAAKLARVRSKHISMRITGASKTR